MILTWSLELSTKLFKILEKATFRAFSHSIVESLVYYENFFDSSNGAAATYQTVRVKRGAPWIKSKIPERKTKLTLCRSLTRRD